VKGTRGGGTDTVVKEIQTWATRGRLTIDLQSFMAIKESKEPQGKVRFRDTSASKKGERGLYAVGVGEEFSETKK